MLPSASESPLPEGGSVHPNCAAMAPQGDTYAGSKEHHGPIETTLEVPREGGRRWYKHDVIL